MSGSNVSVVRYACMGCEGSPTFFSDFKAASIHYARSKRCYQSNRGIKTVSVQVNPSPQFIGDGEAGGAGGGGPWRQQPAPARRQTGHITYDITKRSSTVSISHNNDVMAVYPVILV